MNHTVEDSLIKNGLSFLRNHYKSIKRVAPSELFTRFELPNQVTLDGALRITREEDDMFFVTLEATDLKNIGEVTYIILKKKRIIDGLAIGAFFMAIIFLLDHFDRWVFTESTIVSNLIILTLGVLLFAYIWYRISFSYSRYKYIYAIQQFKKYEAHAKWLLISNQVWNKLDDDDRAELKKQCVFDNIGFLISGDDARIRIVMNPNTNQGLVIENQFLKKNKTKWFEFVNKNANWVDNKERFINSDWKNFVLFLLFFCGTTFFITNEYFRTHGVITVNEKDYSTFLKNKKFTEEPKYYFVDRKNRFLYIEDFSEMLNNGRILSNLISMGASKQIWYDCSRVKNLPDKFYLVELSWYENVNEMMDKLKQFNRSPFVINAIWLGCLDGYQHHYSLFAGPFFNDEKSAYHFANTLNLWLNNNGFTDDVKVRFIGDY